MDGQIYSMNVKRSGKRFGDSVGRWLLHAPAGEAFETQPGQRFQL